MSFDLKLHAYRLLMDEPFFAALSRKIEKRATTDIPTAGVRVDPDTAQFEMVYNPDFFAKLTHEQRLAVLKHEFYHLIFEHVTTRKPEKVGPRIWNFATDLAINSHLENLPEGCLMPGEGFFADFERGLSAEQYLALLLKKQKEEEEKKAAAEEGRKEADSEMEDKAQEERAEVEATKEEPAAPEEEEAAPPPAAKPAPVAEMKHIFESWRQFIRG